MRFYRRQWHVMGGAPGRAETDLLAPDKSVAAWMRWCCRGALPRAGCLSGVVDDAARCVGRGFRLGDCHDPAGAGGDPV